MFMQFLFSNRCEAYIYHVHSKFTTYLNSLAYEARSKITCYFTTICWNVFNSYTLWEIFDSKHIEEVIDSRRNSENKNTQTEISDTSKQRWHLSGSLKEYNRQDYGNSKNCSFFLRKSKLNHNWNKIMDIRNKRIHWRCWYDTIKNYR